MLFKLIKRGCDIIFFLALYTQGVEKEIQNRIKIMYIGSWKTGLIWNALPFSQIQHVEDIVFYIGERL